jgi:iron complex transport system substrate-binding protein
VPGGPVRRVVPLAPDVTELAFALGAGDLVAAAPAAADHPPEVKRLPRVRHDDVEAILSLRPDLVLATTAGNDARVIGRLRELGTRVFTTDVTSFDRLEQACRLVGRAIGRPDEGVRLAGDVEARCALLGARAAVLPRRAAVYVVWWDPLIVGSPGTFHDDLLKRAALDNEAPAGGGRYPRVDPELLLDPRLEVVVAPDERDLRDGFARIVRSPAGERLASGAVRVLWLPADQASRPGPRLLEALEALVAAREAHENQGSGVRGPGCGPPPEPRNPTPQPQGGSG